VAAGVAASALTSQKPVPQASSGRLNQPMAAAGDRSGVGALAGCIAWAAW
jgi:hypothetical protein